MSQEDKSRKATPQPQIDSINDMIEHSRGDLRARKRGKSAGITGDFGNAALLLGELEPTPVAIEIGKSVFDSDVSSSSIEKLVQGVVKACETEYAGDPGPIPGKQVVGSYVHDNKRLYLYANQASDAEESSTQLNSVIAAAKTNKPTE